MLYSKGCLPVRGAPTALGLEMEMVSQFPEASHFPGEGGGMQECTQSSLGARHGTEGVGGTLGQAPLPAGSAHLHLRAPRDTSVVFSMRWSWHGVWDNI